ncbi:MAG: hypothetical protein ACKO96_31840, partial [Flammeovirgaceae bacterium]
MDFFRTIKFAFSIAERSKIEPELTNISTYINQIHQNWDITKEGTLRILLDLSGLMAEYFGQFNKLIDFQEVLKKNMEGAKELEKTNVWGAMYAVDRNITIEKKRNNSIPSLLKYKAELYEKLAIEADSRANLACVSFAEQALRIYQQLNDLANVSRLEKMYSDLRGKFHLSEIRQELPKEHVRDMHKRIQNTIAESNEIGILQHFIITPWYDKIDNIKEESIQLSKESVFMSMLPT